MGVVVVALARPAPERRQEVLAAFKDAVARVHAEESGFQVYALLESRQAIVMMEEWTDSAALAAHAAAPAFTELRARLDLLLSDPLEVHVLRPVDVGDHPPGNA